MGRQRRSCVGFSHSLLRTWTECPLVLAVGVTRPSIAACVSGPRPCSPEAANAGDASSPTASAAARIERLSTPQRWHVEQKGNNRRSALTFGPLVGRRPPDRYPAGHGEAPRHADPRRRHRTRGRRGDPSRAGRRGRRDRVDRAAGRRGRPRHPWRALARRDRRRHPNVPRRHQGSDHDAGRDGLPKRQRRAPSGPRPVRRGQTRSLPAGRSHPARRRRPGDRAREHRGPLSGDRVRTRLGRHGGAQATAPRRRRTRAARRRRHHAEAHQRDRRASDRSVRVRVRAFAPPQARHGRPQSERDALLRRDLPRRRDRGREDLPRHRLGRDPDRPSVVAARAHARGLRRAVVAEPLRRHHLGPLRGVGRRSRADPRREHRVGVRRTSPARASPTPSR
jgi:hypothetical protein